MSKYDAFIAAIRKYSATRTIPGIAQIMGNMAEFLAALAQDAASQTQENLRLQRELTQTIERLAESSRIGAIHG